MTTQWGGYDSVALPPVGLGLYFSGLRIAIINVRIFIVKTPVGRLSLPKLLRLDVLSRFADE